MFLYIHMPYRKYYRRPRRYRRRYKLSRFNLYRKRSSKQQANQIYRINKKINAIEYRTKPEVKIFNYHTQTGVGGICGYAFGAITGAGTFLPNVNGTLCRFQNINIYPTLYMAPGSSNTSVTTTCRLVVFQLKAPTTTAYTLPEQVFNITPAERTDSNIMIKKRAYMKAVFGPLKHGIATEFKILRDVKLTISGQRNQRFSKKLYLKKGLRNLYINPNAQEGTFHKGYVGWIAIFTNNSNEQNPAADTAYLLMNEKIAYIDES